MNDRMEGQRNARRLQTLIRIALGLIPYGVIVSELLPDVAEAEQHRMLSSLSNRLNALQFHLGITDAGVDPLAIEFAKYAANYCWNSEIEFDVDYDDLIQAVPCNERDADIALRRMVRGGWIQTISDANSPLGISGFLCCSRMFAAILPEVNGISPVADAIEIAHFLLASEDDYVEFQRIRDHFNWDGKRLYVGLWLLKDSVIEQEWEGGYSSETPLHYVELDGNNRVSLQDFVALGTW